MHYWSSNLGNNRPRSLAVETLLRDGNIQFWTSKRLWSTVEERKKKNWRRHYFTVSQLQRLWTRMCCRPPSDYTHTWELTSYPFRSAICEISFHFAVNILINSAFHPSGVEKSSGLPACLAGLKRDLFTCVGWQVTLCKSHMAIDVLWLWDGVPLRTLGLLF